MNKADLIGEVAKVVATKKAAQDAVDTVFASITKALKKKEVVTLVGFGTFKVGKRKARTGRNPQTGAAIKIAAKKVPRFVAGKGLKDVLKNPVLRTGLLLKKKPFWPFIPFGEGPPRARAFWLFHVIDPQKKFWSPRREETCLMRAFCSRQTHTNLFPIAIRPSFL